MKIIYDFLKGVDIYGKPIELNIKGKQSYNSIIGGIMSLLYLITFLVIFTINLMRFFSYDSPKITVSSEFRNQSTLETIQNNQFFFGNFFTELNMKLQEMKYINSNPSSQESLLIKLSKENSKISSKLEILNNISSCNAMNIYNNITQSESFRTFNKSNNDFINCFDFGLKDNITLGGDIIGSNLKIDSLISLKYDMCDFLGQSNCTMLDIKNSYLNKSKFRFINFINNFYLEYKSILGYSSLLQMKNIELDLNSDYSVTITAKKIFLSTDNNLIYNIKPNIDVEFFIYSISYTTKTKSSLDTSISINYEIEIDPYTDVIERSYVKLDEMLANIGSIIIIFEFVAKYITDFFSQGNLEFKLYKEIFHIRNSTKFLNGDFLKSEIQRISNSKNNYKDDSNLNKILKNNSKNIEFSVRSDNNFFEKNSDIVLKDLSENEIELKNIINYDNNILNIIKGNNNLEKSEISNIQKILSNNASDLNNNKLINEKNNLIHFRKNLEENNINYDVSNKIKIDINIYKQFKKYLKDNILKKSNYVKLYQIFFCKTFKNKNLDKLITMEDFINNELDIVKILKKLIEYENFKRMFITQNQMEVFTIMQKRVLEKEDLENDASKYYDKYYFNNDKDDIKKFLELFGKLFENTDENNKYSKIMIEKIKENYNI